jgi:aminoglycoside phosphotransferase (APT) family kinase protein
MSAPITLDELVARARHHGLDLSPSSARLDTSGLDFVALHAYDRAGVAWIIRVPRREDVVASARDEATVLAAVRGRLGAAVPDWRVHTPELIAYPRLPGTPLVTLDTGAPVWNVVDPASPSDDFLDSYARVLAALQAIPHDGLRVDSIADARARLAAAITTACEALTPPAAITERWRAFACGSTWPTHVGLAHGDLHPGHILVDEQARITGILDWTEARVTDPGVDFCVVAGAFGRAALERLVERFVEHGGQAWPGLIDHAVERWAVAPALAAEWAVRTNNAAVLQYARDQLATLC